MCGIKTVYHYGCALNNHNLYTTVDYGKTAFEPDGTGWTFAEKHDMEVPANFGFASDDEGYIYDLPELSSTEPVCDHEWEKYYTGIMQTKGPVIDRCSKCGAHMDKIKDN
jgi:hypothetical protein